MIRSKSLRRTSTCLGAASIVLVALTGCGSATDATAPRVTESTVAASPDLASSTSSSSAPVVTGLAGTSWLLVSLPFGGGSHTPSGRPATLNFATDGTVAFTDGCNVGDGTYDEVSGHLDLELATTLIACPEDPDSDQVVAVLTSSPWMTLDGSTLTLYDGTPAGRGLVYASVTTP